MPEVNVVVPPDSAAEIQAIVNARPAEPRQLLPLLQEIQARFRYLPPESLRVVASRLDLPLSRVFSVASFYHALSLKPKGRKVIQVCCGTACHLRGSAGIIDSLEDKLSLELGWTTPDGEYTLESVNCLGACALAPVLRMDGETHGHQTPRAAAELISLE